MFSTQKYTELSAAILISHLILLVNAVLFYGEPAMSKLDVSILTFSYLVLIGMWSVVISNFRKAN